MNQSDDIDRRGNAAPLEERLHDLLRRAPYASDDRRLARVYLGIANLLRPRLNAELRACLDFLNSEERKDAAELRTWSQRLGEKASEASSGQNQEEGFFYRLLESCAKPKFTIFPDTDVEPIAWALDIGLRFDDVLRVVQREYPEIEASS